MPLTEYASSVPSISVFFPVWFFYCAGDWTQILGVFASRSNIKAEMLTKLLLEAILLAERAGLFVEFLTCDSA